MTCESDSSQHEPRLRWKSLGQLSELWGLSRARTRFVLRGLVRSGRMEVRTLRGSRPAEREYRVVCRG